MSRWEASDTEQPGTRPFLYQLGAGILLVAALFGTFIAWLSYGLLCDENCSGRSWELVAQLYLALAGLAPAGLMAYFAFREHWSAALRSLAVGLAVYAVWAVLLSAATHAQ
jgi:hypothetical protein